MEQQYNLGKKLHAKYVTEDKFLSPTYNAKEVINNLEKLK